MNTKNGNNCAFSLIKSAVINGINIDCYAQNDNNKPGEEFWLTREQIGKLLGYSKPVIAIGKIHQRNKERLDQFSRVHQVDLPSGGKQMATLYSFKGLLEVCRFSNQPKSNEVINRLWDIAYEISRKGYYAVPAVQSQIDALTHENKLLREQVGLLQAQCNGLKAYIQDNSSFTLLGQSITPVKASLSVGEAAKIFAQHGIKIGQNRLFKLMRDLKLIAKRKGRQWNQPTQKSIEQGLCVIIVPLGSKGTPYITMKGMQVLAQELAQEQFPLLHLIAGADALHE